MKKLFLIIPSLLLASLSLNAQNAVSTSDKETTTKATTETIKMDTPATIDKIKTDAPKFKFQKTVHDFGNLKQNVPATFVFEFTNTSTEVISLQTVQAGCGCTTPEWTKEPVSPGKTGKIPTTYNSVNPGNFTKSVTITFSDGTVHYLTIKGNVESPVVVPNPPIAPVVTPGN